MGKGTITEKKAKSTVIDLRGHLLGRALSIVAKKIQNGEKVTLVRCEEANISGSHIRNKLIKLDKLRKRTLTNPGKGPFHHRAPSAMVLRTIRGMVSKNERNHAKRGKLALKRLVAYDGVPQQVERQKRFVIPSALRVLRLAPGRKYTRLGRLSHELGWKHQDTISALETARKARSAKYFESKKENEKLWAEAKSVAHSQLPAEQSAILTKFGY